MNNTTGAFYDGFGTMFLVTPDVATNRQGRAQFWPAQPPPLPLFTKPREAVERSTLSGATSMTIEQHLNLMAQYKAYAKTWPAT